MNSLLDIQSQIEKLQKQANEIKAKEFDKTVREIISKMKAFGITVKDLQPGRSDAGSTKNRARASEKTSKAAASKKPVSVVAVKYRGPDGETWSGRGLTPRWLSALISQGGEKDDFLIKK